MERVKKCAASRYCRLHTAVKLAALVLMGSIVSIVMLYERGAI